MQSIVSRANTLVFYGVTCLFLVFAAVAVSDTFNFPSPTFEAQVLNINRFRNKPDGDDEVSLMLQISADLESLFTFNTKQVFVFVAAEYDTAKNRLNQVSLWDDILTSKDEAKFQIRVNNKYHFVDQTGRMFAGKIVSPGYRLPVAYK